MEKSKKRIIVIALLVLISIFGISYAFFNYSKTGVNREIIAGDIWLEMKEDNGIYIRDAFPMTREEALKQTDNTNTFTISGANTTEDEIIYYEIKLNEAEQLEGKTTRISPNLLRFDLIEEKNGVTTTVIENASYNVLNETKIWVGQVESNTTSTLIKYTLRMWLSEDILISNTDPNADYTTEEWQDLFASVKVSVYGDLKPKEVFLKNEIERTLQYNLTTADSDGTRFVTGSSPNNYVTYSGHLWRIVAINNDGSIKMVTQHTFGNMAWDTSSTNTDYSTSQVRNYLNNQVLSVLDDDLIIDKEWDYTTDSTSDKTKPETTNTVTDKVGLLTSYEYNMTGSYLRIGKAWWLLTPYTDGSKVNYINSSNSVKNDSPTTSYGIRPSVNLKSSIIFTSGDGTSDNPYKLLGDDIEYKYHEYLEEQLASYLTTDIYGTKYVTGEVVNNNYVWYSGKLWRIVALNGDGTVKLVTQNAMTSIAWDINSSNDYRTSQMRSWLNNEFLPTLEEDLITTSTWDYTGYDSFPTIKLATTSSVTDKVGLLTIYDYMMAGGTNRTSISITYLNNGYYWWTMSPYTDATSASNVWGVYDYGYADWSGVTGAYGARPSVNLISDIRISGGTGEYGTPYTIEGDKATGKSSELLSNRINGEYVKFNNTLYRIVGVETINGKKLTKITMADYSVNKNTIATEVQFGATSDSVGATFTPTSGIGLYLKNWYEGSKVSETSRAMVATAEEDGIVWYQGPNEGIGYDYTLSKAGTPISATIGLPYYGEMFSTQQGAGYEESTLTCLMTKYSASYVWHVYGYGYAYWDDATYAYGGRPSVYLKSNIRLGDTNGDGSVGTGQINSPYELVLE